ncbi:MAG: gamma-glutamyltransferase [Vicinamibacterales bacterium]
MSSRSRWVFVAAAACVAVVASFSAQTPANRSGIREPAFSPDGKRLAVSWLDELWTMSPDGRDERKLVAIVANDGSWLSERDPAWSPDGRWIAFSADTNGEFDVYAVPVTSHPGGGVARRVTSLAGDERWPSWTRDGRLVFSHRPLGGHWQMYATRADGNGAPVKITPDDAAEWHARVSPDGRLVAFISDRDREAGDEGDVFVRELAPAAAGADAPAYRLIRLTRAGGGELFPAWAPDSARVSYTANRPGVGAAIWVTELPRQEPADETVRVAEPGTASARGEGPGTTTPAPGPGRGGGAAQAVPIATLVSRRAGTVAWSPDGQTLAIATLSATEAGYNGNPNRSDDDETVLSAAPGEQVLWLTAAPRPIDAGARALAVAPPAAGRWAGQFDRVWQTLKSLYYREGASAIAWDGLREKYRPRAMTAKTPEEAEDVVDALIAQQPLIKPSIVSTRGVVASGHPLASAAGALMLEKGGNIVDAIVATSFALGVVEPDASGIGGDGQAILYLKGMREPIVIEYKDMTPGHATRDNPKIFRDGQRTASDGPTVANIPGVVAGLTLLHRKYGSKKVTWAEILAPAIALAEDGYILDEALPTTIAAGRDRFAKYPEAAKIYLPGGKVPKPGDRFINKDYAETLKVLAKEGGDSFYRGSIARRIAADMEASGGIITVEDLAQYRAMERVPLSGRYRGHLVYSAPPPVSTGLQIVETLQILDNYTPKPGATYATDADYFHHAIEAWRVRDTGAQISDPERWPINLGNHLQPAHALERFKLIDPRTVYVAPQGGRGRGRGPGAPIAPAANLDLDDAMADGVADAGIQTGTTSFVAADPEGNMVAVTQTLSTWGGNFYVSKGLGFLYNDHFRGGRTGTSYGSMLPLMRSTSTSVPTLVFAPGFTPRLAVGAAGNAWIPASVYEIILNVVDGGMGAQRAIEAPRFLIGNAPGGRSRVQIEDRIPRAILRDLEARGHTFVKVGRKGEVKYGYAALALVNTAKGAVEGGAEPRRSHAIAAAGK